MKASIIIAALMLTACAPAHAGGLAPSLSVVPPERPSYAPIMEGRMPLARCERPVYGQNGQLLYWVGGECQTPWEDGPSESVSVPESDPIPEEPPFVEEVPEEEPPVEEPETPEEEQPEKEDDFCKQEFN